MSKRGGSLGRSGASRTHAAGEFTLLTGGAEGIASPDGADGRGQVSGDRPRPHLTLGFTPNGTVSTEPEGEIQMARGFGRRGQTRSDTYAVFDLRRDHGLHPLDCWTLLALERLVDYSTWCWTGALIEFANDYTGMSTRTVSASFGRLEAAGLLEVLRPFTQGGRGTVRLLAFGVMQGDSDVVAPSNEPRSAHVVTNSAIDQPERSFRKEQGAGKEEGSSRASVDRDLLQRPALGALMRAFPTEREAG